MKQKYLANSQELLKEILQKWRYNYSAHWMILFWAILGYLISNTSKSVLRARIHFISVVTISGLLWKRVEKVKKFKKFQIGSTRPFFSKSYQISEIPILPYNWTPLIPPLPLPLGNWAWQKNWKVSKNFQIGSTRHQWNHFFQNLAKN